MQFLIPHFFPQTNWGVRVCFASVRVALVWNRCHMFKPAGSMFGFWSLQKGAVWVPSFHSYAVTLVMDMGLAWGVFALNPKSRRWPSQPATSCPTFGWRGPAVYVELHQHHCKQKSTVIIVDQAYARSVQTSYRRGTPRGYNVTQRWHRHEHFLAQQSETCKQRVKNNILYKMINARVSECRAQERVSSSQTHRSYAKGDKKMAANDQSCETFAPDAW